MVTPRRSRRNQLLLRCGRTSPAPLSPTRRTIYFHHPEAQPAGVELLSALIMDGAGWVFAEDNATRDAFSCIGIDVRQSLSSPPGDGSAGKIRHFLHCRPFFS